MCWAKNSYHIYSPLLRAFVQIAFIFHWWCLGVDSFGNTDNSFCWFTNESTDVQKRQDTLGWQYKLMEWHDNPTMLGFEKSKRMWAKPVVDLKVPMCLLVEHLGCAPNFLIHVDLAPVHAHSLPVCQHLGATRHSQNVSWITTTVQNTSIITLHKTAHRGK